jgi:hypothetical protein
VKMDAEMVTTDPEAVSVIAIVRDCVVPASVTVEPPSVIVEAGIVATGPEED